MTKLSEKVAVVTGGNSGIGFATAQELVNEGAKVIITGRNEKAIAEAVERLGKNASGFVADVAAFITGAEFNIDGGANINQG